MKQMKYLPVKGTRDFYPEEMAFRNWLFEKMKSASQKFGYQQYDGPILEPIALYESKSGEDLVKNQTYSLKDRGGEIIALRPEMTPTLARMVAQKQNELPQIIRWFNIGQRFRYEKPQKGRFREFYQWDVDLLGVRNVQADTEILAVCAEFLRSLGLSSKEVKIKLNDRKITEQLFGKIGTSPDLYRDLLQAIDRKEKMEEKAWKDWLLEIGLTKEKVSKLMESLEVKDTPDELTQLFEILKSMGIADYFEYDPTIVRGLDYYTGLVFEARDADGEFRAIFGGGRYDNLVEVVGGEPISGIGFAVGDAVIEAVLEKFGKKDFENKKPLILISPIEEEAMSKATEIATQLRLAEINTQLYLDPTVKLEKQLKFADNQGIKFVAIIGSLELEKNSVTLKNLETRSQKVIKTEDLVGALK